VTTDRNTHLNLVRVLSLVAPIVEDLRQRFRKVWAIVRGRDRSLCGLAFELVAIRSQFLTQ
jgi:hypothetical protein